MIQNFIHVKKQALSKNTCDTLIQLFEDHKNLHVEGRMGGIKGANNEWKRDTEIPITPNFLVNQPNWKVPLRDAMNSLEQ